jgi:hypothetical protein
VAEVSLVSTAYGRTVGARVDGVDEGAVRDALPFWWDDVEGADPERWWSLHVGNDLIAAVSDLELWVAEHALDLVFIHAAVVEVAGRAIVLPGRSLSGKSSLCAALVSLGAAYYSDEYAVLGIDGRVFPYARPMSLRAPDGSTSRVSMVGPAPTDAPIPVGVVAALRYMDGGGAPTAASKSAAVLSLIDNAVAARSRTAEVSMACVAAVAQLGCALQGERGEAAATAEQLIALARSLPT